MQIYELTTVNEGILDKIKSGFSGAQRALQGAALDRQTQAMAKKAYQSWRTYAAQLDKAIKDPAKKAAFNNRTDGLYQKSLAAWVQQNLMRNLPMTAVTNKKEISDLIQQLSAPKVAPTTPATPATSAAPAAPVKAATATPAAATTLPQPPPANLPNWTTGTTGVTPSKVTTNMALKEALSQGQEQELFNQLVQQVAVAQYSTDLRGQASTPGGPQPAPPVSTVLAAQQLLANNVKMSPTQLAALQSITRGMEVRSIDPTTINMATALGFKVL